MLGCGCTTRCGLANDLIIEQVGYNIIASISLFKIKVKMFWFIAGVCMIMAISSKSLSYRYLVVLVTCILLLRVCTEKQWDRTVSLQYASWLLCTVSQWLPCLKFSKWRELLNTKTCLQCLNTICERCQKRVAKKIHSLVYLHHFT